jgi:hypothetical protein
MNVIRTFACLFTVVAICAGTAAHADLLAITSGNGHIWTRDHSNLGPDINDVNFGGGVQVRAALNSLGELGVGTSLSAYADVRHITNPASDCCGATFGPPPGVFTAVGVMEGDHFALGGNNGQVFVRDRTNLGATAPGVSGDGIVFNTQVNAIARLSNGHLVIGNNNGELFVRDKNNIAAVAPGANGAADGVNFGIPITSLAITASDDIVIGLSGGMIDTRPWSNIFSSHSSINFGIGGATHVAMRSDGNALLGFGNGEVYIRNALNLGPDVDNAAFGFAITALTVDKNDNAIIGDTLGQVFVRDANNLGQTPAGFSGDGINFGESILSLNVVPEPATLLLIGLGLSVLRIFRRVR